MVLPSRRGGGRVVLGLGKEFKGLVQCRGHPGTHHCVLMGCLFLACHYVFFSSHLPLASANFLLPVFQVGSYRDHTDIPVSQLVAQFPPSTGRKWPRHLSVPLHSSCSIWSWRRNGDNSSSGLESRGTDPVASHGLDSEQD